MSKKTPKSAKAKTKSAHNKQLVVYSLSATVLIIAVVSSLLFGAKPKESGEKIKLSETCLQVENNCFGLEVADTKEKHMKGLSGKNVLPEDKGMLFVFERSEEQCFWMKDMKFSLDIIWLDEKKKIVKIRENVPPDTYPDSFCAENTKYVLEFNAGFAAEHGLKPKTRLQF